MKKKKRNKTKFENIQKQKAKIEGYNWKKKLKGLIKKLNN